MKKQNLKMLALGFIATLAITSCSVHNREYYNRRPPRHDRDRDRYHDRDHDRHDNDHYYHNY